MAWLHKKINLNAEATLASQRHKHPPTSSRMAEALYVWFNLPSSAWPALLFVCYALIIKSWTLPRLYEQTARFWSNSCKAPLLQESTAIPGPGHWAPIHRGHGACQELLPAEWAGSVGSSEPFTKGSGGTRCLHSKGKNGLLMNNGTVFNNPLVYIKNCKADMKYEGTENSEDILEGVETGWREPPTHHTTSTTHAPDSALTAFRPQSDPLFFFPPLPRFLAPIPLLKPDLNTLQQSFLSHKGLTLRTPGYTWNHG